MQSMDPWIGKSLNGLVGKREMRTSTFNAFFFETLNKRDHVALFGLRNLELRQGRGSMTRNTFQSLSLMRMPRWTSSMSLVRCGLLSK